MGEDVKVKLGDSGVSAAGNLRDDLADSQATGLRNISARKSARQSSPSRLTSTTPSARPPSRRAQLAGLEVVRILNEPTAAALTYDPRQTDGMRVLVYDLGGGTFDVSIVHTESGVVEVLASQGDTHLGGDDFDELLLNYICDRFARRTWRRPARRSDLPRHAYCAPPRRPSGRSRDHRLHQGRRGVHRREGWRGSASVN